MSAQDELNTPGIAMVGLISVVLVFAIIMLLTAVFYQTDSRRQAEENHQPPAELTRLETLPNERLAEYKLIDKEKNVYAIPIKEAMKKVAEELAGKPPGSTKEEKNEQ